MTSATTFSSSPDKNIPSESQRTDITEALDHDALITCSDGSHFYQAALASHGWVLADNIETILSTGSAPTDGHPSSLSSYRAELSGLLALLYMLYKISCYYNVEGKNVTIDCDNKGALQNIFKQPPLGITPFFNTDYDLLEVAHDLVLP